MSLTNKDHKWGPLTWGRAGWNARRLVLSSGGGTDDTPCCTLTAYCFGWVFRLKLPPLVKPFVFRVDCSKMWDAETIKRIGRDWYDDDFEVAYGFSYSPDEGHLSLYYGVQNEIGVRREVPRKYKGYFLPWTQWRSILHSYYGLQGEHFWTEWDEQIRKLPLEERRARSMDWMKKRDECPAAKFEFKDYDGELVEATAILEEREWHFGEKWCKWLSWFRRPKIRRSLDLKFSKEIGREKGSWKGGTVGHGIELLPGELHEAGFKRYCEQEHRSKSGKYKLTYVRRTA